MIDEELASAKLEEVESLIDSLTKRRMDLLKALESFKQLPPYENKFNFNPPIPRDSGAFKNFLVAKVLEAHKRKHGVEHRITESTGVVSAIEFSKCNDDHRKEIVKACAWVQRVASQTQGTKSFHPVKTWKEESEG